MLTLFKSLLSSGSDSAVASSPTSAPSPIAEADSSVVLLSSLPSQTAVARKLLEERGFLCPRTGTATLDRASDCIKTIKPTLILVFLQPDPEKAITALQKAREESQARILAIGPSDDPKLILRTMRAGADEYLDESEVAGDLSLVLKVRKSGNHVASTKGKIVSVIGAVGGAGVSTVTANLGISLSVSHQRAVLIDGQLQTGSLAALLDLKPDFTLGDLGKQKGVLDRGVLEKSFCEHVSGARMLASPRSLVLDETSYLAVRRAAELSCSLSPFVLVDLGSNLGEHQWELLQRSDRILLVLPLSFLALKNAHQLIRFLAESKIDPSRINLVANRTGQAQELTPDKVEESLDVKSMNRAANLGEPVVVNNPSSKAARALHALAQSLGQSVIKL